MSLPTVLPRRAVLKAFGAAPLAFGACAFAQSADDPVAAALAGSGAPGLAGAVFDRTGTLFLGAAGLRKALGNDPVTTADRWHLGSNTKAMTALLYARFVEQGRIADGATLASLFPEVKLDAAFAGRTAEDLMAHAAGIGDETLLGRDWLIAARSDTRPLTEQRLALATAALSAPPAFPEGGFHYANLNFIIVGAIIERAAGKAWEEIIAEELFTPLGIMTGGFGAPQGEQPWGHAMGIPVDPAHISDNPPALGPAGTVHMALEDYGRFLRLFLTEGGGYATPATMARITTAAVEGDGVYRWGWMVYGARPWAHGPALAHEGSNTMWHAIALAAPKRGVAIAAVSNDEAKGGPAAVKLALELMRRYAPA